MADGETLFLDEIGDAQLSLINIEARAFEEQGGIKKVIMFIGPYAILLVHHRP